jgi:hypothetical protein
MLKEIGEELRAVVAGRGGLADGVIPPLVFVVANAVSSVRVAAVAGVGSAVLIVATRLATGARARFAVSGLAGTTLAAALAAGSGRADAFFLPGILSGAATTLVLLISIVLRRPAVAFTSWVARGWPLDWYWHPRVRPAYTAVSWLWAGFFGLRAAFQFSLYRAEATEALAATRVVLGWPALLVLLVATYVLGRRRLVRLGGPSVEEFESGEPPPWAGQARGF